MLLFIVRVAVYQFPFVSGDILSTVVGALLICSGIALIVGLFSNRSHNFCRYYPVSSQSPIYWSAISSSAHRSWAFCHCGIYCRFVLCCRGYSPDELVSSAFNERQLATARYWCAGYRHCLDIPWCNADGVCNAGFHTGGIELIFSAASLFSFASLFVKQQ